MLILFDLLGAQPNTTGSKFHGGGEYSKTVFKALVELRGSDSVIVFYDSRLFLDDWIKELIQKENIKVYDVAGYHDLEAVFQREKIDVYFSGMPYGSMGVSIPKEVRKMGTFHGLRSLECPTDAYEYKYRTGFKTIKAIAKPFFQNRLKKRAEADYAANMAEYDDIVCVSNHTKYAIKNFYPGLLKEPNVFYTPAKYVDDSQTDRTPLVKGKYILMIGLNRWEKNGYRGLMAVDQLFYKNLLKDYQIVTVGEIPSKIENSIHCKERHCKFGYVAPEELENLYANCDFFLYPSLNEGFGMPPLEAMRYGKTCIVSGVCSLPEVCGDAVYYCNPYDIEEIRNRILMASEMKIDPDKVVGHFQKMVDHQNEDLHKLCLFILGRKLT